MEPAPFSSFTVSMVALTAARTMARLSATLIVLTLSFSSFPARADSDHKKVCKIGADLKTWLKMATQTPAGVWPSHRICRNINSAARVREMKILSC